MNDQTKMELGGGALAILALGAGAFAVSRRRRRADEEELWENEQSEPIAVAEPVAAAEPVRATAPRHDPVGGYEPRVRTPEHDSAFAWNRAGEEARTASDERRAGETWVERAYRGPSADNPSQSLRKRLKRAAFFDKREREAAASQAAPVEADAGLPERAMAERELELA